MTSAGILETVSTVLDAGMEFHDRVWIECQHGTVSAIRAFGRLARDAGRGSVVRIGSISSHVALPLPAYCPSKTAVPRLTEMFSGEPGRHGIRVKGVAPTCIVTSALQARIDAGERDPAVMRAAGTLDMLVRPEHVASVAAFLCSDAAAAVTGLMTPVDAAYLPAATCTAFAGDVPREA